MVIENKKDKVEIDAKGNKRVKINLKSLVQQFKEKKPDIVAIKGAIIPNQPSHSNTQITNAIRNERL